MDFVHKLLRHNQRTREILASMTMSAQGWSVGTLDVESLSLPHVHLYVWDQKTDWIWAATVPIETFARITEKLQSATSDWEAARSSLGHTIRRVSRANVVAGQKFRASKTVHEMGLTWESELVLLVSAYAGTTSVLRAAAADGQCPTNSHFFVLHYSAPGLLRPFMLGETTGILPATAVIGRIHQVVQMDRINHPEWFG